LVKTIGEVKEQYSVTVKYCCEILKLNPKRYKRWLMIYQRTARYGAGKPGPKKALHAMMPEERKKIIQMAKDDTYQDLSHRQLAITASESAEVEASASSFYRIMKEGLLMEKKKRIPKVAQKKPEINKPEAY
jgi:putative transposase